MRIFAIDTGSKRIGLAISDPTGVIASPLKVLTHVSILVDAARVAEEARANEAGLIVIGQSLDDSGRLNLAGRRAVRFAEALKTQTSLPIVFWDEAFTTQDARATRIQMNVPRKNRSGHLDALAASLLLQSYLEANPPTDIS
jgi:putative Holliday junction resolvase